MHTSVVRLAALGAAAALVCLASAAHAQTATGSGNNSTQLDITVNGAITSAIELDITGTINLLNSQTTVVTGGGSAGAVNFGTYTVAGGLLTGEVNRVNGKQGSYVVATLECAVLLSGGYTSAVIDLQRSAAYSGAPDVPIGNLFFAVTGFKKAGHNRHLSWPRWNNYPDSRYGTTVFDVPDSTYVTGAGNLDNTMVSGDYVDHQVAIWIPDSQTPGPFSTTVTYTATAQ